MDDTMEDEAWKDSFDKLCEPRAFLKELNILKRNVRVSFNMNSSIENTNIGESSNNMLCVGEPSLIGTPKLNLIQMYKPTNSISTPLLTHQKPNPFKCSISPVGVWKFDHFDCIDSKKSNPVIRISDDGVKTGIVALKESKTKKHPLEVHKRVAFEISDDESVVVINDKLPAVDKDRPTSLTLQPGKWRKSLKNWRRTHIVPVSDLTNSHVQCKTKELEYSIDLVEIVSVAGARKSVLLHPDRQSANQLSSEWKHRVLNRCNQKGPFPFDQLYCAKDMKKCSKIGEGVYGEVFINLASHRSKKDTVLKIIPIEGKQKINGEVQKTFEQIFPEIIISKELSSLRNIKFYTNSTPNFVDIFKVSLVQGKYPDHLIQLWEDYDEEKESENDNPRTFPEYQKYIVLELEFGGEDLSSYGFKNAEQSFYALQQIVISLAVGENVLQFEHRDLHWGNVLIKNTTEKFLTYKLSGTQLTVPSKGIKTTIIDYTLSRATYEDCCLYNDLSNDEELFAATGDYQYDIYRLMRNCLQHDWKSYDPKTNIFWISYIISKMVDGVTYRSPSSKAHTTYLKKLKDLQNEVLRFPSTMDLAKFLLNI